MRDIDWDSVNWLGGESPFYLLWCWNPRLRDACRDSVDGLSGEPPIWLFGLYERLRNVDLDVIEGFYRRLGSGSLKLLLEGDILIRVAGFSRSSYLVDRM